MKRYPDWQVRMQAFVRERRKMPFAWGRNDCAVFAADYLEAVTGERVCTDLRAHTNAREALQTLERAGGVRAIATRALGEPIPVVLAGVGDVVVIAVGKREALAVCNGGTAVAPGPAGVVAVPMQQALAAWRVG